MIKAILTINYNDGTHVEFQYHSRAKAMIEAMVALKQKRCTSVMLVMLPRPEEQT